MPATMMIGGRMQVVSDEIANQAVTERIQRSDDLAPHKHFVENLRAATQVLDEADDIAIQLEPKGAPKSALSTPLDRSNDRSFETKAYAQASVRDAERAFGLSNLSVAWDASGKSKGWLERDHPTVIHLNPGLLHGDVDEIDRTVAHEAWHSTCVRAGRAWNQEEETTADEAGEWFRKWRRANR